MRGQVDSDRHNASEWFQRGNVAHEKRQYGKALAAWKKASQEANAEACYRIGRFMRAEKALLKAFRMPLSGTSARPDRPCGSAISARYYLYQWRKGRDPVDQITGSNQRRNVIAEAAKRNLETLFPNGIAVEKDLDAAIRWMTAAARNRNGGSPEYFG